MKREISEGATCLSDPSEESDGDYKPSEQDPESEEESETASTAPSHPTSQRSRSPSFAVPLPRRPTQRQAQVAKMPPIQPQKEVTPNSQCSSATAVNSSPVAVRNFSPLSGNLLIDFLAFSERPVNPSILVSGDDKTSGCRTGRSFEAADRAREGQTQALCGSAKTLRSQVQIFGTERADSSPPRKGKISRRIPKKAVRRGRCLVVIGND